MRKKTINANQRQRHQSACGDASLTVTFRDDALSGSQIAKHITGAPQARRHAGRIMKATHAIGSVSAPLGMRARCPRQTHVFPNLQSAFPFPVARSNEVPK